MNKSLTPLCNGYVDYQRMLRIGKIDYLKQDSFKRFAVEIVKVQPGKGIKTYNELFSQKGWQAYKTTVSANFKNVFKKDPNPFLAPGERVTVRSYLKNTIRGYNLGQIRDAFAEGKIATGLARCLGLGLFAYDVVSEVNNTYQKSVLKENGYTWTRWNTVKATLATAVRQTIKSAIAWEVATVGMVIGSALFPIGTYPAFIVGAALGVLLGKLSGKCFDILLRKPLQT